MDETLIKQAASEYIELLCRSLPEPEECHHTFSRKFEKKMQRLIEKADHPVKAALRRIAACLAVAVLLAFGAAMVVSVDARDAFSEWVREQYASFTRFISKGNSKEHVADYSPNWVPKEYEFLDSYSIQGGYTLLYANSSGNILNITYSSSPENLAVYIYSEACPQQEIQINGIPAQLYIPDDTQSSSELVWQNTEGTLFVVSCNCDESTLIRIAEKIEKKQFF